jgi:hypothetical protein
MKSDYKELKARSIEHVYFAGNEIIITGCANEDDEEHNCDCAGCGQQCVLFRGLLAYKEFHATVETNDND